MNHCYLHFIVFVISDISKVFQSMSNPNHEVMMKEVTQVALTCVLIGLVIGFTSLIEVSIKPLKICEILKVMCNRVRFHELLNLCDVL